MTSSTTPELSNVKKSGVSRVHDPSLLPKLLFSLLHFCSVLVCMYLVWGSGLEALSGSLGRDEVVIDMNRAQLLLGAACLYWIRHTVTLFYLLVRRVDWGEVIGLSVFIFCFEVGLCIVGGGIFKMSELPLGHLDVFAGALLIIGSYINTGSEMQRKWWKQNPDNRGRCYTEGMFKWSMHINYLGDVLLFSGWCLLTATWWTIALPIFMALSFVFYHIPGLDEYLAERYGEEFIEYANQTKKLIPFIY